MESGSNGGESDFHKVLGRALVDVEFRNELISGDTDRQTKALQAIGIEPTREQLDELNSSVEALQRLSGAFGDAIAAT